jgi:prepilin-type N-terminal cleavage/methylation domain-containing protein/prepilin-type processing-associated H-X9-DG protein
MTPLSRSPFRLRCGFSLIELLIVITIIGILIAAMTPAIESSREAARRTQCQNNLRNLGVAATLHLNAAGYFPSGGWGYRWAGDPDHGFGASQPGGWVFSVLPYIEEKPLWSVGAGINFGTNVPAKQSALKGQVSKPLAILICPTRRDALLYPYYPARAPVNLNLDDLKPGVVKTDYAINSGDTGANQYSGPPTIDVVANGTYKWPKNGTFSGVAFQRSEVTAPMISDGLSHTYLIGEKYINALDYATGTDKGDNDAATQGFDNDMCRIAGPGNNPRPDTPEVPGLLIFGSSHAEGFNMAFCDGSVHMIDYEIDADAHSHLANRADGQSVSSNSIH